MTPTPPSTTPATTTAAGGTTPDQYRVVRKRNRIPLSCAPCRHRKLKCNRQQPCDNCTKRGDSASCTYATPAAKRKGTSSSNSNGTPDDMQNRIDRLEGLVLSLMTNGSSAQGTAAAQQAISAASSSIDSGSLGPNLDSTLDDSQMMEGDTEGAENESETDGVTKSFGILKVDHDKQRTFYVGEAHWAALLNEISEVKNYFKNHKNEYEAQMEKVAQTRRNMGGDGAPGPALLFGASVPPPRAEILSQLPSKYMSDILVGRYFNSYDPATHILHGPSFQRHYQQHWVDPSKTSIVWIAMLFAIMRLAMISYAREGDEPPEFRGKCQDYAMTFRTQMAHCLITADYTKPHNYIIETLIFHLHAEFSSNRDSEASVWVLVGMIVRLAMRMGYHRDSKFFPDVTPFNGEMRRRVWTFVRTADLLFSFQIALPPMVRLGDSDTELPRNIYDDEFDETSTTLPPPRPASEATPVSYLTAKGKLAFGFGRVLEEINGVDRKSYDEVLKIDKALREIYDSVPEHLKIRPMSEQQLAPLALIMARFSLATVYNKALCVLHRRYVRLAKNNNSRFMYSRKTCLESAMQLLSFQAIQWQQSQERGRMRSMRNHISSLTAHDYLLAGTLVCMDLYSSRDKPADDVSTPGTTVSGSSAGSRISASMSGDSIYVQGLPYTRDDVVGALEQSRDIWMVNRDVSMEAYKASELLNVLIFHLKQSSSPRQQPDQTSASNGNNDEQTAAMTLGMLQQGGVNSTQAAQAAQMAQQAQQQMPWDKNALGGFTPGELSNQMFGSNIAAEGNSLFGPGNGMFPNTIFAGGGANNTSMNIDWEAWDQYMQPSNLSLDPAAGLWSANSPNNNYFTQTSSPDQINSGAPTTSNSDLSFANAQAGFFPSTQQTLADGTKDMSGNGNNNGTSNGSADLTTQGTAGDTFMGATTPGQWKWTVMDGNK